MEDLLKDLGESVDTFLNYLNGIRDSLIRGLYTPESARADYDILTNTSGLDIFSTIEAIAEWESEEE